MNNCEYKALRGYVVILSSCESVVSINKKADIYSCSKHAIKSKYKDMVTSNICIKQNIILYFKLFSDSEHTSSFMRQ